MFRESLEKIKFHLKEDECTFLIISRPVLLRMRNVSEESYRANQNAYFIFNFFFPSKIVPLMRSSAKNIAQPDRPQITIWRMCMACWIP